MAFSYWCCRLRQILSFAKGNRKVHEDLDPDMTQLRRFSLEELQTATNNFNNENIIGRGGFGKVYKGSFEDGSAVAVKRFMKRQPDFSGENQFLTTSEIIKMATHRNVLKLIGCCLTPNERLLVYPYMPNGSLSYQLRERHESKPALNWETRKRIALGVAEGICHLHEECKTKIIHLDIKAANILLDEEFEAIVGDFGLAKLMDSSDIDVTDAVRGTIGHIAPEYLSTGRFSDKSDVYGFGVMLLELVTAQRAFDLCRIASDYDVSMLEWVKAMFQGKKTQEIVDSELQGDYAEAEVGQLIKLALLCTQSSPDFRPKMAQVVEMLKGNGLDEKWVEMEKCDQAFRLYGEPICLGFTDSVELLSAMELSGPR